MTALAGVSTRDALASLLDSDPDDAVETVRANVGGALAGGDGLVFAGAGQVGRWLAGELARLGVTIDCFADNSARLAGVTVDGIPVLTPAEAVRRHPDATFVTTIFTTTPLAAQLAGLGARQVISWTELAWAHGESVLPYFGLALPHGMIAAADDIMRVHDLLADERSRRMLVDQVRWRLTLDTSAQEPPARFADIYAEPDVCVPTSRDVYVDCGAFDGDSIAAHLDRVGGDAAGIVAIEADPANLSALTARVAALPGRMAERVVVHAVALGARRGQATFRASGSAGSALSAGALSAGAGGTASEIDVEVAPLDELIAGRGATYIKMDIEGAEPDALAGAANTLAAAQAVWAVCLYHAADHLWRVPLQIADSGGAYRHSMRRYTQDCWELVHYAVPLDRQ